MDKLLAENKLVALSLVLGSDGSLTINGNSRAISSTQDRARFLTYRKSFDCLLIGGSTARAEPYRTTPIPLIIISKTLKFHANPISHIWNCDPITALARAHETFGPRVLIEGGPALFKPLLSEIAVIQLTITKAQGGENRFNWQTHFNDFKILNDEVSGTDRFLTLSRN